MRGCVNRTLLIPGVNKDSARIMSHPGIARKAKAEVGSESYEK